MHHVPPFFAISPLWTRAFWISYAVWIVLELWIFRRDRRPARGVEQDRGSRTLIIVLYWGSLFAAFTLAYNTPLARLPLAPEAVMPVAIALIWAGVAFRLWAVLTLGRHFRTSVTVLDDHRLVEAGPYRWLRNPSYTGALATLLGCGLALGDGLALLVAVGGPLIGYVVRIRVEEQALRARFAGAFEGYKARTWSLIPFLW